MNQIAVFLSFLSTIGIGAIVGTLFGRWLARGQPHISLIGIETEFGVPPLAKSNRLNIPNNIVELSHKFKWADHIDNLVTLSELSDILLQVRAFDHLTERTPQKAESLLNDLKKVNIDKDEKIRIIYELLDDEYIKKTIIDGLRRQTLQLSPINDNDKKDSILTSIESEHSGYHIEFPEGSIKSLQLARERQFLPDAIVKERISPFVDAMQYGDKARLETAITHAKNDLRAQREIAQELIESIKPLQSNCWKVETMVANRGDRIVLLSPYAMLTTRGSQSSLPSLPLTAFSTTSTLEQPSFMKDINTIPMQSWPVDVLHELKVMLSGAELSSPRTLSVIPAQLTEKFTQMLTLENIEFQADKYLVLKPQSASQITFFSDEKVDETGKYRDLAKTYNADLLSCSIVLKREDVTRRKGRAIALHSSWVSFGRKLLEKRREEVANLVQQNSRLNLQSRRKFLIFSK